MSCGQACKRAGAYGLYILWGYVGCGITDAAFIVRQLQEQFMAKKKNCILHLLTWRRFLTGSLESCMVGNA